METNFDGLDDLDSAEVSNTPDMMQANVNWARKNGAEYTRPQSAAEHSPIGETHEMCRKCGGSGVFRGPSQYGSKCFACSGTGKGRSLNPKNVRARERNAEKKAQKTLSIQEAARNFLEANADIATWITANPDFQFAQSLNSNLLQYGRLSENQIRAARDNIANQAQRSQRIAEERKERQVDVAGAGFTKLIAAFQAAKDSGLKNPAMVFERVCFKYAKKYPGQLYVTAGKAFGSDFYGRINEAGKFDPRHTTTQAIIDEVKRIGADPFGEAKAHGHRTGNCCCCGRELTNNESIDLGIGPICAKRWGF